MPRNVEIKARVDNMDQVVQLASDLCKSEGVLIEQNDTFFITEKGRLKLRLFKEGHGELIFYDRPDTEGPKLSDYSKCPVEDPESLKQVLTMALGVRGCVCKTRLLFLYNSTRIHLDQVQGLGNFMELEVVLDDEQTVEEGSRIAEELLKKLAIPKESLLCGAYMDMQATATSVL